MNNTKNKNITVTLIAAQTADGFIARNELDRSFDWTSPEDKIFYVSKLKASDAVVMGSKTFGTFKRYPRGSHFVIMTRNPEKLTNPSPSVIKMTPTDQTPQEIIEMLAQSGHRNILIAGGASMYRQFLQAGLVDRIFLTIEPILFGKGIGLLDQAVSSGDNRHIQLVLREVHSISDTTIVLEYSL